MSEARASGIRTFGSFALDLDRGCLLRDGVEVPLRPKTFAVLAFLAASPGRLVSKDELIRAVWRGAIVSDDVLVQSVGELRRALGDKGEGVIRTVPRRGYRFEISQAASVSEPLAPHTLQPQRPHRSWLAAAAVILVTIAAGGVWMLLDQSGEGSHARAKPAVAVLPFTIEDGSADRQYFVDGLTQHVIDALGRFSSLTVESWDAVLPYRNVAARDDATASGRIARDLGAQYLVRGSVQRTAERVRVNAQLVNPQGWVLWSHEFNERLADLFPLQDRLIHEISAVLALQVTDFELQRVVWTRPGSVDAYDYLLQARSVIRNGPEGVAAARDLLNRAIELDHGYAAAWSTKGLTYLLSAGEGWGEPPAKRLAQAEEAASKALQLDPADVQAHVVLGRIHLINARLDQAQDEMEHALAINPNDSLALEGYGEILLWQGHTDEAIEVLNTALRIRPGMKGSERFALAMGYYLKDRCSDAMALAASGQSLLTRSEITTPPLLLQAACEERLGHADKAAQTLRQARDADPMYEAHARTFGTWLKQPQDLQRLRDGLVRAGQAPVWETSSSAVH